MGWRGRTFGAVAVTVGLVGAYVLLDVHDVVPGLLTLAPPYSDPVPFPVAPGAVSVPQAQVAWDGLPEQARLPTASDVRALIDDLVTSDVYEGRVGVVVADAMSGVVIGSYAADDVFTPASTQKLLTALAVFSQLDASATLATRVQQVAEDQVVLVGGGDMMLSAGAGDPLAVRGRAGLDDLARQAAEQIRLSGRSSIRLAVNDSLFSGPAIAAGVPQDEVDAGFIAPVASMAVNLAAMHTPGFTQVGARHSDPAMAAAEDFAAALQLHGITVVGELSRINAQVDGRIIAQVDSATIGEITAFMLTYSENTLAELLGRLVAIDMGLPGTGQAAVQGVLEAARRMGVDIQPALLADLSGLARGSQLTPSQVHQVLAASVGLDLQPDNRQLRELAGSLPVANLTGTLATRFVGSPGRGWVRAKTGSLPEVSALAGTVVTAQDRLLIFVVLIDDIPDTTYLWGAREAIDSFSNGLAELGFVP